MDIKYTDAYLKFKSRHKPSYLIGQQYIEESKSKNNEKLQLDKDITEFTHIHFGKNQIFKRFKK